MKIYVVAGEASGDARGAELMRALLTRRSDLEFFGAGGPKMKALAGGDFLDWADEAVVGLWDVLKKYGYFKRQFDRMLAEVTRIAPDALILIDYPGFNLRLAEAARSRLPHTKILYYISPQVWAWNRRRIPKMAKYLDLMLCIFPFEKPLYEASGLPTEFIGHPMLDSLAERRIGAPRERDLVALLPGSRGKEVRKIFPAMLEAARILKERNPALRFEAAAASETLAIEMRALAESRAHAAGGAVSTKAPSSTPTDASPAVSLNPSPADSQPTHFTCEIRVGVAHELMQRAAAGMVCSGTATLEAAYFGLPMAIIYKVAWLTWVIGKRLVRVPFLGMPNILAEREIVREFLQDQADPRAIADEIDRLITNPEATAQVQRDLASVIAKLGEPGAGARAAAVVEEKLGTSAT